MRAGNESEREREEKLLNAIGNLPEEMIAQAAEYKRPNRRLTGEMAWKGLAVAACAALVIFGGTKAISLIQTRSVKQQGVEWSAENRVDKAEEDDSKKIGYDGEPDKAKPEELSGNRTGIAGSAGIQLWATGVMVSGEAGSAKDKDSVKANDDDSSGKKKGEIESGAQILMKEGETVALKAEEIEGDERSSARKKISVLTFQIAQSEADVTYTLHSQTSNCKIVAVTHDGTEKYVNLPDAECTGGDTVALDAEGSSMISWERNIVPEWTDINIMDIINISGEEEGEKYEIGRIVIGQQIGTGERYYGMYQSKDD